MTTAIVEQTRLITGDELLAMPEMEHAELIDGVIKEWDVPGAEHGYLEIEIAAELRAFVKPVRLGWVMGGEVGIYIQRGPDRVRKFDIAFLSRKRSPLRPPRTYLAVAPELIVEIMSPTDRWNDDFNSKIADYFRIGVDEVWIVEPHYQHVRQYVSADSFQIIRDQLHGSGILTDFILDVPDLFE